MQWNEITPYKQTAGQAALVNQVLHDSWNTGATHTHTLVDYDGLPIYLYNFISMQYRCLFCPQLVPKANMIDLYLGGER